MRAQRCTSECHMLVHVQTCPDADVQRHAGAVSGTLYDAMHVAVDEDQRMSCLVSMCAGRQANSLFKSAAHGSAHTVLLGKQCPAVYARNARMHGRHVARTRGCMGEHLLVCARFTRHAFKRKETAWIVAFYAQALQLPHTAYSQLRARTKRQCSTRAWP
jgi:hypothetical protein